MQRKMSCFTSFSQLDLPREWFPNFQIIIYKNSIWKSKKMELHLNWNTFKKKKKLDLGKYWQKYNYKNAPFHVLKTHFFEGAEAPILRPLYKVNTPAYC